MARSFLSLGPSPGAASTYVARQCSFEKTKNRFESDWVSARRRWKHARLRCSTFVWVGGLGFGV